jgi:hypothetical protein
LEAFVSFKVTLSGTASVDTGRSHGLLSELPPSLGELALSCRRFIGRDLSMRVANLI